MSAGPMRRPRRGARAALMLAGLCASALGAAAARAAPATALNVGTLDRELPPRRLAPSGPAARVEGLAELPPGAAYHKSPLGLVATDAQGRTLYAMDGRIARRRVSDFGEHDAYKVCVGPCAELWIPFRPAADAKPVGRWRIVEGAAGPQWAFAGNAVFTYRGDARPGAVGGHEYEDMWMAILYVPPPPAKPPAPPGVTLAYVDGEYLMADGAGRPLFVYDRGGCAAECADVVPLAAGFVARSIGDWSVSQAQDRPQWAWRGRLVYTLGRGEGAHVPPSARVLRP